MLPVQMCQGKNMAFLLKILQYELENPSCLTQMVETLTSATAELKVCLDASWLGLQPGRQKRSWEREGGILIFANRGDLQNTVPVSLGSSSLQKSRGQNMDILCWPLMFYFLPLSFFILFIYLFLVEGGDFIAYIPQFLPHWAARTAPPPASHQLLHHLFWLLLTLPAPMHESAL